MVDSHYLNSHFTSNISLYGAMYPMKNSSKTRHDFSCLAGFTEILIQKKKKKKTALDVMQFIHVFFFFL